MRTREPIIVRKGKIEYECPTVALAVEVGARLEQQDGPRRSGTRRVLEEQPRERRKAVFGEAVVGKGLRYVRDNPSGVAGTELAKALGLAPKAMGQLKVAIKRALGGSKIEIDEVVKQTRPKPKGPRIWNPGERISEAISYLGASA